MAIKLKIKGIGKYLPPRLVPNKELANLLNTTDEWIETHTGITQRYWADIDMSTSTLAFHASKNALDNAQIKIENIDMILLATVTPDHEFPGTACFLQEKLGIRNIPAIDVRQQCSGFIYALSQAQSFIESGLYKTILVVCAELHSKCMDLSERGRAISVLFGDGAAALVVQGEEIQNPLHDSHLLSTSINSDGRYARDLWCQAGGTGFNSLRLESTMLEQGLQFPHMNGRAIYANAVQVMSTTLMDCLKKSPYTLQDLDYIFFHQANLRIIQAIQKKLNLVDECIYNTIQIYGNTTSATIPLSIEHAVASNKLKSGMLIAAIAFGSGYTWGSALIRW